jgi:hypothetical protein
MRNPTQCSDCWRVGAQRNGCNCLKNEFWRRVEDMKTVIKHLFEYLETDLGVICDRRRCTRQAVFIVRIHQIDHCVTESDKFYLLCKACTDTASWRMGELIGTMYAQLPDSTETVECLCDTCGKRIMEVDDVVTVERLIPQ